MVGYRDYIEIALKEKTTIDATTGCWLYGRINDYRRITISGKREYVHRLSAFLYLNYDLNNKTLDVLHNIECPNKNCWYYKHLRLGTHQENMGDKILTKTSNNQNTFKSICKFGHDLNNPNNVRIRYGKRICIICRNEYRQRKKLNG